MTAYFDEISATLRDWRTWDQVLVWNRLTEIESRIYDDVCFCCANEDFPADLKKKCYETLLRFGVNILPDCASPADFEENSEYADRIRQMSSDLHSIFHEVAYRGIPFIGDSPRHWLSRMKMKSVEELERMAEVSRWGPVRERAEARGWKRYEKEDVAAWTDAEGRARVIFDLGVSQWVSIRHRPTFEERCRFRFEPEALTQALLEER